MYTMRTGFNVNEKDVPEAQLICTLFQKGTQVRFWIQATIPAPNDPPGSRLSENVKFEILQVGTLTSDFWKTRFFSKYT